MSNLLSNSQTTTTRISERKRIIRDDDDTTDSNSNGTNRSSTNQPNRPMTRPRREYNFSETSESLLAKYSQEPPSIELHIYHTHYRFGNQEGVIPKNSPLIKSFFEYMEYEAIPPAATEVFRDSGIKFYEGCVIMQLIDHRTTSDSNPSHMSHGQAQTNGASQKQTSESQNNVKNDDKSNKNANDTDFGQSKQNQPITYRTILRPTPLSLWHELLYTTDTSHGRFSDQLALSMEAEILALTTRNLDLRVPDVYIPPFQPSISDIPNDKNAIKSLHTHRIGIEEPPKPLHEDQVHHGSDYEEIMLILDDQRNGSNASTTGSNSGQFMRLSFIEQLRKKRERMRQLSLQQQQQRNSAGGPGSTANNAQMASQNNLRNGIMGNQTPNTNTTMQNNQSKDNNRIKLTQEQRIRYARYRLEENKKAQGTNTDTRLNSHMPMYVDQIPSHLVDIVLRDDQTSAMSIPAAPTSAHQPSPTLNDDKTKATVKKPRGRAAGKGNSVNTPKGRPKKTV